MVGIVDNAGSLPGMVTIINISEFYFSRNPQNVECLNSYDLGTEFGEVL